VRLDCNLAIGPKYVDGLKDLLVHILDKLFN